MKTKGVVATNSNRSTVGSMRCATCGKKIVGDFLYYQKTKAFDWYYVCHHKQCTEDHECWKKEDARKEKRLEFIAACKDFRDKWGCDELDFGEEDATNDR